jgi:hypothetical protein
MNPMPTKTVHGLGVHECISAMQKCIRRGLAAPHLIPLVETCCRQARAWYDPDQLGKWRMAIGTAIRALARAAKSREGDHFQAAVGLRAQLEDYAPAIPDWALDQHTRAGRRQGRGVDHFRRSAAKLHPAPAGRDPYEAEAYRLWKLRESTAAARSGRRRPGGKNQRDLF